MEANKRTTKFFAPFAFLLVLAARPCGLWAQSGAHLDSTAAVRAHIDEGAAPASALASHAKFPSELLRPGVSSALYIKVRVPDAGKLRSLKSGETIVGTLAQTVYSGTQEVFPAASQITLTVRDVQRCRKPRNDHWPWVAAIFIPRHQNCPAFEAARVSLAGGQEVPLQLSLISMARERHVRAVPHSKKPSALSATPAGQGSAAYDAQVDTSAALAGEIAGKKTAALGLTFTFEGARLSANGTDGFALGGLPSSHDPATFHELPAGTPAKVILLGALSASKSHPGDLFRARLIEPVKVGAAVVLPEGAILEGHVAKVVRPRSLSRSGSLLLFFDRLIPAEDPPTPLSATVTGARLDEFSHTNMDPEGMMRGDHPGKVWMLINLGATAGVAKVVDDTTQLVIEAIVSTATDVSTAGTARIVASCASGLFMMTRRGRDVVLPQFTELDIAFNRSVRVPLPQAKLATGSQSRAEAQR
jgi:hypothetical protein